MAVSRETALYYDPDGGEQAARRKAVLACMGVRIKNIAPADAGQTIGCLLGRGGFGRKEDAPSSAPGGPMLVLDGFSDKRLEILLRELRGHDAPVPHKAVVTETNINWTLAHLYEEVAAEHAAMSNGPA